MHPSCGLCRLELLLISTSRGGFGVCPRCDTTNQGNGQRVGPPNLPGTRNGWFNAPFGDLK